MTGFKSLIAVRVNYLAAIRHLARSANESPPIMSNAAKIAIAAESEPVLARTLAWTFAAAVVVVLRTIEVPSTVAGVAVVEVVPGSVVVVVAF